MTRSFITEGEAVPAAAPYDVTSGSGALIGSMFGVALGTFKSGEVGEFGTCGVHELKKTSAQAWTQGIKLYWDNTAKEVTSTAGANTLIGCAYEAAVNPSATGKVRLNGTV